MLRADLLPELWHPVVGSRRRYAETSDLGAKLVILGARVAGARIRQREEQTRGPGSEHPGPEPRRLSA